MSDEAISKKISRRLLRRATPRKDGTRTPPFAAMTKKTNSEAETMNVAADFARSLHGGEVVLMSGELGAGKSTFVRGMARAFGIRDPVRSPTFTLMHVYPVMRKPKTENRKINAQLFGLRF